MNDPLPILVIFDILLLIEVLILYSMHCSCISHDPRTWKGFSYYTSNNPRVLFQSVISTTQRSGLCYCARRDSVTHMSLRRLMFTLPDPLHIIYGGCLLNVLRKWQAVQTTNVAWTAMMILRCWQAVRQIKRNKVRLMVNIMSIWLSCRVMFSCIRFNILFA